MKAVATTRNSRLIFPLFLLYAASHSIATAQPPGAFSATGGMTTARHGHTATLLTNGRVLIAGGQADPATPLRTAEIYDPESGRFTPTGDMTAPRYAHTATLLPDGRVLLAAGGITAGHGLIPSNVAEIYDPSTGTFAATGTMIGNHACQEAHLLGSGKVLIAGGADSKGGVSAAELYDPATGTFAATGSYTKDTFDLNACQGAASSLLPDGRVLIVWQDTGAEIYDPDAGSFTSTGTPASQSYNNGLPSATLLINGTVLVAGGANDTGFHTRAELYDLSTETFTATGNMTTGRSRHTATLLPDGSVLMTGTYRFGGGSLASAELYDPVAGAFAAVGAMTTARAGHTATLLPDGRVLIAGGSTFGQPTALAELYTPRGFSGFPDAPRLFSVLVDGRLQGAIWNPSTGQFASPRFPAAAGEALSMYTTRLSEGGLIPPQVSVGGRLATILYFGAAPGLPGYYQVNFRVPAGVAAGPEVPVRLTYIGRPSNEVTIAVQ